MDPLVPLHNVGLVGVAVKVTAAPVQEGLDPLVTAIDTLAVKLQGAI